jgi:hypothetical protein
MLLGQKIISANVYRGVVSSNRAIGAIIGQKIDIFSLKNVHGAVVRAALTTVAHKLARTFEKTAWEHGRCSLRCCDQSTSETALLVQSVYCDQG